MWANRGYLFLAILVFIIAMVVQTPLQFVWPKIKPHLASLPITLTQVQGTLWQGQANIQTPVVGLGDVQAQWRVSAWSLLRLQPALELQLEGRSLSVTGELDISLSKQIRIQNLNAYFDTASLKPALSRSQIQLGGDFNLEGVSAKLELAENRILVHKLAGHLLYSGGNIGFPIDGKPIQAELPPLSGVLAKVDNQATLELSTNDNLSLGRGYIQMDGWAGLVVKRRFLDVLKQPWPAKAQADTVIFEASQKLFN